MGLQSNDPHVGGQIAAQWRVGGVTAIMAKKSVGVGWCCGCVLCWCMLWLVEWLSLWLMLMLAQLLCTPTYLQPTNSNSNRFFILNNPLDH
jgi:hypothetical protein